MYLQKELRTLTGKFKKPEKKLKCQIMREMYKLLTAEFDKLGVTGLKGKATAIIIRNASTFSINQTDRLAFLNNEYEQRLKNVKHNLVQLGLERNGK